VTFPLLEKLIDELLNKLNGPDFEVHRLKDFRTEIQSFGSLETLKAKMLKCIPPEVKRLQGKKVTREL
jgi:hypothetical protein